MFSKLLERLSLWARKTLSTKKGRVALATIVSVLIILLALSLTLLRPGEQSKTQSSEISDIYSTPNRSQASSEIDPSSKTRISELSQNSPLITRGKVASSNSSWTPDKKQIYTYITMAVKDVLKGKEVSDRIVIKQLGGRAGDMLLYIPDAPRFQLGEDVIVMLKPWGEEYVVVGLSDGKFGVRSDPAGTQVVESTSLKDRALSLDDFERMIGQ